MNKMFEKIIAKKKAEGKPMSPSHKKAKGSVLSDLMEHLGSMGLEKVKGMKKVSVASDSKEGLKEGLEKAESIVEGEEESPEMELGEMESEDDMEESEEKSEEELKAEIEALKAQIEAMKEDLNVCIKK